MQLTLTGADPTASFYFSSPRVVTGDVNGWTVEQAQVAGPTRGTRRLSGSDKADTRSSGKPDGIGKGKGAAPKPRGDVGRALRSVYDDTLREEIPLDLKDLLGRLD